ASTKVIARAAGGVAAHNRSTIRLTCNKLSVGDGWRTVSIATQKVCTWSSVICADMPHHLADVRFTPKSGYSFSVLGCPLCAIFGLMHCSKAGAIRSLQQQLPGGFVGA